MISAVNFILESGISLSFLAVIYVFLLRKETFFRINRWFLLGSVLFSIILPFLKFKVFTPQPTMLAEVTVTPYRNLLEAVTIYSHGFSGDVERAILSTNLIVFIYLAGVLLFLGIFIYRLIQLIAMIRKNPVQRLGLFKMVVLKRDTSPFSFLDYIFVGESYHGKEGYERMLAHELEHIKQGHSFDVIILELLTAFQWFNPFMWMLRRAIRENHEYLADNAVLKSGVNKGYYKKLLLDQFVGGQIVIGNGFNYSLIKSRIKMMSRMKSSKLALTKIIFGFAVALVLIIAFACEQKDSVEIETPEVLQEQEQGIKLTFHDEKLKIEAGSEELDKLREMFSKGSGFEITEDSLGNVLLSKRVEPEVKKLDESENVFFIVEEMPLFPGGDLALRKYIANAVSYPKEAQENGIQGKVYVTFVVARDGSIANSSIARGVDPLLDKEALRVVNGLPKWKPGKQKGEPVNVSYTVPINFVLK